jgi:sterol desaturase/sphingolipid hydroxylase (fatty acid hydroxylase superfamily)
MITSVDLWFLVSGVLATTAAYWLAVAFYTAIPALFPTHASRYKIQAKERGQGRLKHGRLIALTLFNQIPLTIVMVAGAAAIYFSLGAAVEVGFPHWPTILWHFIGWLVVFEIGFYSSHRLLHTRWLYRRVHLLHHRFTTPVPYSAACVHPVEFVMSYIVPTFVAALIMHLSYAEMLLFLSVEYVHTVHDHNGHFYAWDPFRWLCTQNARMHDEHHRRPTVNFGGGFTSWPDRLCGTYARRP